jgi:hypothetical protein
MQNGTRRKCGESESQKNWKLAKNQCDSDNEEEIERNEKDRIREIAKKDPNDVEVQQYIEEKKIVALPIDAKVFPNAMATITRKIDTSDKGRHVFDSIEHICHKFIFQDIRATRRPAFEEAYDVYLHPYLDLDDVDRLELPYKAFDNDLTKKWKERNNNTEKSIREFLTQFVTYWLQGLKKSWKKFEVELHSDLEKISVKQIVNEAAISVKVSEKYEFLTGIHIVFTNVITHQASYSLMKDIVNWIRKQVDREEGENKHPLFGDFVKVDKAGNEKRKRYLDGAPFKLRTRLRTIYSVKDEADFCKDDCEEFPCMCIRNKVYIPLEILNNNITDKAEQDMERLNHYFTYIHKEDIQDSLHFELIRILSDRDIKKLELLQEKSKEKFNSHSERKLAACVPLLDFGIFDHRAALSRFVYLNAPHLRESLVHWFQEMGASDHIPKDINYNWDTLWANDKNDWQVNWGLLINKMKENNEDEYKVWARKYSKVSRKELDEFKPDIEKLIEKFTHNDVAHDYKKAFPDSIVYQFGKYIVFDEKSSRWNEVELFIDDLAAYYKPQLDELTNQYQDERDKEEYNSPEWKAKDYLMKKAKEAYRNICTVGFCKDIMTQLKQSAFYKNENIDFDTKWNLRGFENCVLDLEIGGFREHKKNDYVSKSTGYAWREPEEDEMKKLDELDEKIQPDPEIRLCEQTILSTALIGRTLEKFIIFNGNGRNGKGLITELLLHALGCNDRGYAYKGSTSSLTGYSKDGPDPAKANMHKKTFVVFEEVSKKRCKFNNGWIKDATGGSWINARKCNSNETNVRLMCTMIANCNGPPKFQDPITDAERERLIDIYFPCKFTTKENEVNEATLKYKADPYYKTDEFKNKYKFAMIRKLLEVYKKFKGEIYIPESVRKRTSLYLSLSHWFIQWFHENYEYVERDAEDYNKYKDNVIPIKRLVLEIKDSDYYETLSYEEKRDCTIQKIAEEIETSAFGDYYVESYDNNKKHNRIRIRHVIIGFKNRNIDEDDD